MQHSLNRTPFRARALRSAFAVGLVFLPTFALAQAECARTAVVNLSFNYKGESPFVDLKGVHEDARAFEVFKQGKKSAASLEQIELSRFGGKKGLLKKLRELTENAEVVQFNYFGHGVNTISLGEIERAGEKCEPTETGASSAPGGVISGGIYLPAETDISQETVECLRRSLRSPALRKAQNRFALAPRECLSCKRKCEITCQNTCVRKHKKPEARSERLKCLSACGEDFSDSCSQKCAENYCISKEELAQAFKGKKLFGVIDACHSAGVDGIDSKDASFLTSTASAAAKADDTPNGGLITVGALNRHARDYCTLDKDGDGMVDLRELTAGVHKDFSIFSRSTQQLIGQSSNPRCAISLAGMGCANNRSRDSAPEDGRK